MGELVVTPYRMYVAADLQGAAVVEGGAPVAYVTWSMPEGEVVTLEAMVEHRGYGRLALEHALRELQSAGHGSAKLHTTNDNARAIGLYLRLGWRLVKVHLDAMDRVRELKPGVPLEDHGLPLQDMWEFHYDLAGVKTR